MSIHWPGSPMCSNASYRGAPSGTNWTRCCHGTGKRLKLRKPTTPRSVCVRSFAEHPGCRATGTDHAKAQVDRPFRILPSEDHTTSERSNVGRVQRLRALVHDLTYQGRPPKAGGFLAPCPSMAAVAPGCAGGAELFNHVLGARAAIHRAGEVGILVLI